MQRFLFTEATGKEPNTPIKRDREKERENELIEEAELMHRATRYKQTALEGSNLNIRNAHPKDAFITFDDPSHVYTVNGKKMEISVTEFKSMFFPKFDQEKALQSIFNPTATVEEMGKMIVRRDHKTSDYKGCDREGVLNKWDSNRTDGTLVHDAIERYNISLGDVNPIILTLDERKARITHPRGSDGPAIDSIHHNCLNQYLEFEEMWYAQGWRMYRVEWSVYSEKYGIAGSIDAVCSRVDKITGATEYAILDWKRSKKSFKTNNGRALYQNKAYYPLNDLMNTDIEAYNFQMNIYMEILTEYGIRATMAKLIQINPLKHIAEVHDCTLRPELTRRCFEIWSNFKERRGKFLDWEKSGQYSPSVLHPSYPLPCFFENKTEFENTTDKEDNEIDLENVNNIT